MRLRTESLSLPDVLDGTSSGFRELIGAIRDDLTDLTTRANELNRRADEISAFLVRESVTLGARLEESRGMIPSQVSYASGARTMSDRLYTGENVFSPDGTVVWDPRYGALVPAHERESKVQLLQYSEAFVKKYMDIQYYMESAPTVRYGGIHDLYAMVDGREDTWALLTDATPGETVVLEITLPQQLVSNLTINSLGMIFHPMGRITGVSYVDANTGEEIEIEIENTITEKKTRLCFPAISASVLRIKLVLLRMTGASGTNVPAGIQSLDLDMLHPAIQDPPRFVYHLCPSRRYPELAGRVITGVTKVQVRSHSDVTTEFRLWKDALCQEEGISETQTWIEVLPQVGLDDAWEIYGIHIDYELE